MVVVVVIVVVAVAVAVVVERDYLSVLFQKVPKRKRPH